MPSCRTSAAMTGEDSDHHVVQAGTQSERARKGFRFGQVWVELKASEFRSAS